MYYNTQKCHAFLSQLNHLFNLGVLPISIKFTSILPTSKIFHLPFLMEVHSVEANQCMKSFYPSFDLLVDDDATIILSFSSKIIKILKIYYYLYIILLDGRLVFIQISIFIHINVLLQHIRSPLFIFCELFLLLLQPPPPYLYELQKWSELVLITT